MPKFETIKAGDVLWEVRREAAGNTRMTRVAVRPVYVMSVDHEKRTAMCHWNSKINPLRWYNARSLAKLRRNKPEPRT